MVVGIGKCSHINRVERIDDVPVLIKMMQKMELGKTIDNQLIVHGNWTGLSVGNLTEVLLSYILSEADHRLNKLEDWAMGRLYMLKALYPSSKIERTCFTDDKLELVLDYLSDMGKWDKIEQELNGKILRVYRLAKEEKGVKHLRVDATVGQSHKKAEKDGLFQFGSSKHFNPKLTQFKTMLSTLDTQISGCSYPLCSVTVSGNTSDDVLYIPIIEKSKQSLAATDKLLIIGDKKMGSKRIRTHIVNDGDYYLTPLTKIQVPTSAILDLVKEAETELGKIQIIELEGKKIGEGFWYEQEQTAELVIQDKIKLVKWVERRAVVRSEGYILSQKAALERRISKTQAALDYLLVKKQGKQTPKTRKEIQQAVSGILEKYQVKDYFNVSLKQKTSTKKVRGYGSKPDRSIKKVTFSLQIRLLQDQIETAIDNYGWCVYATNAPEELLTLTDAVQLYREQFQIESRFNDLKNKVTKLLPIYLQKDNRIKSLINLMMVGLKVICAIEVKVAQALKKQGQELAGIYAGNPTRKSKKPSAKMLLSRFKEISISIFLENDKPILFALTTVDTIQLEILKLLGLPVDLYNQIIAQLNSIFLSNFKRT
ncbi:MAG: transposase [Saprospiraceae bacterium]